MRSPLRLTIFLIIAMLIIITFSQMGGGGGGGGGGSYRSRSRSSYSRGFFSTIYDKDEDEEKNKDPNQQVCRTIRGITKCKTRKESQRESALITLGVGFIWIIYWLYSQKKLYDDIRQGEAKIKQSLGEFQAKFEAESFEVPTIQKNELIEALKKQKYVIELSSRNSLQQVVCTLKDIQIKQVGQHKYTIEMAGSDQIGRSKFTGLLMFKPGGLRIKLSKTYNNRIKAGQTQKFIVLLYQGQGTPQKIEGEWAFQGWQTSPFYSGPWQMIQIKD